MKKKLYDPGLLYFLMDNTELNYLLKASLDSVDDIGIFCISIYILVHLKFNFKQCLVPSCQEWKGEGA